MKKLPGKKISDYPAPMYEFTLPDGQRRHVFVKRGQGMKEAREQLVIPLQHRPELRPLLAELRQLDPNGWCIATDGSCDDLTTEQAIESLTNTITEIKKG